MPPPEKLPPRAATIDCVARAIAQALRHNSNPYRASDKRIDVDCLAPRAVEYALAGLPGGPERPSTIDPFSALVGGAMALGYTMFHSDNEWKAPSESSRR